MVCAIRQMSARMFIHMSIHMPIYTHVCRRRGRSWGCGSSHRSAPWPVQAGRSKSAPHRPSPTALYRLHIGHRRRWVYSACADVPALPLTVSTRAFGNKPDVCTHCYTHVYTRVGTKHWQLEAVLAPRSEGHKQCWHERSVGAKFGQGMLMVVNRFVDISDGDLRPRTVGMLLSRRSKPVPALGCHARHTHRRQSPISSRYRAVSDADIEPI